MQELFAGGNCLLNGCPPPGWDSSCRSVFRVVLCASTTKQPGYECYKSSLWHQLFNLAAKSSLAFPTSPSNSQRLQRDFATMSDSKPWRDRSASWSDGRIDFTLPSFESITTSRPVDLTKTYRKDRDCPRQYVWAKRFDGSDQPKPDDADEICDMSFRHHSFLPFLRISPISHQRFPAALYLRWELTFFPSNAALIWNVLSLSRDTQQYFNANEKAVLKRLHPVFVEAHNGLHFGRWVNDLSSRPARATGLFIQVHGDE